MITGYQSPEKNEMAHSVGSSKESLMNGLFYRGVGRDKG